MGNCLAARSNGRQQFLGQEAKQDPVAGSSTVRFSAAEQNCLKWKWAGSGEQRLRKSLGPLFPPNLVLSQGRVCWSF